MFFIASLWRDNGQILNTTTAKIKQITTKRENKTMTTKQNKTNDPNILSRADFARLNNWGRARVSQLAKEGRLVLADNGKDVCVIESLARIEATRDISKIETVTRHAKARDLKKTDNEKRLERELNLTHKDFLTWFDYAGKLDGGVFRLLRAIESSDGKLLAAIEQRDTETIERFIYSEFDQSVYDDAALNDDDVFFADIINTK
jgi:hypothetical protein